MEGEIPDHEWELGIDHLTLLDLSPPELVSVADEAGFDCVGLRLSPASPDEEGWPMEVGAPMLRETRRLLEGTGVRVLDVEVMRLRPDTTPEDYEALLEAGAELGARFITVNCDDPEIERAGDTFAALTAAARPYGLRPLIEALPYTQVSRLAQAVQVAERSDGGGVLLDPLHLQRAGDDLDAVRSLPRHLLAYMQLCDAPLDPPTGLPRPGQLPRGQSADGSDTQLESRTLRLLPGDGELPLRELVGVVGAVPLSVEAPNLAMRKDLTPVEFARRARRAVAHVLGTAPAAMGPS